MGETVEVRCPVGPQRLFTKLHLREHRYIQPENLIEFSCGDCSRAITRHRGAAWRVLHRFDFLGNLVESIAEPR